MSLKEVCRACLSTGRTVCSLLKSIEPKFDSPPDSVVTVWQMFTKILATHEDRFSDKICMECFNEIQRTYSFILKCKRSDDILKKIKTDKACLENLEPVSLLHEHDSSKIIKYENDMYTDIAQAQTEIECVDRNYVQVDTNWRQFEENIETSVDSQADPLSQDPLADQNEQDNSGSELLDRLDYDNDAVSFSPTQESEPTEFYVLEDKSKSEIFLCPACSYHCRMRENLEKHIMENHMEGKLCKICNKDFTYRPIDHCYTHLKLEIKCKVCSKIFRRKYDLTNHLTIHSGERPFKCEFCTKTFRLQHHLTKHLRCHEGALPFKCKICSKAYRQKYNFKRHLKGHPENSETKNEHNHDRTERYYSYADSEVDQRSQDTSIVEHVDDNFEIELLDPMRCSNEIEDDISAKQDIKQEPELDMSMENYEFEEIESEDKSSTHIFKCPVCCYECRIRENMVKHIIEKHSKERMCKICNLAFTCSAIDHFRAHLYVPDPEEVAKAKIVKQHKCPVCSKIFRHNRILTRHLMTHRRSNFKLSFNEAYWRKAI